MTITTLCSICNTQGQCTYFAQTKVVTLRQRAVSFEVPLLLIKISTGSNGGPHSQVCACLTLPSAPIDKAEIFRHSFLWKEVLKKFCSPFQAILSNFLSPPNFSSPKILFFCEFKPLKKFHNLRTTPFGRKVAGEKKEKRRKHRS